MSCRLPPRIFGDGWLAGPFGRSKRAGRRRPSAAGVTRAGQSGRRGRLIQWVTRDARDTPPAHLHMQHESSPMMMKLCRGGPIEGASGGRSGLGRGTGHQPLKAQPGAIEFLHVASCVSTRFLQEVEGLRWAMGPSYCSPSTALHRTCTCRRPDGLPCRPGHGMATGLGEGAWQHGNIARTWSGCTVGLDGGMG